MPALATYVASISDVVLSTFNTGVGLFGWAVSVLVLFVGFTWYLQLWDSYRDTEMEPAWKFLTPSFFSIFLGLIVGWYFFNVSQHVPLAPAPLELVAVRKNVVCDLVEHLKREQDYVCQPLDNTYQLCYSNDIQSYLHYKDKYLPVRDLRVMNLGKAGHKLTVSVGRHHKAHEILSTSKKFEFEANGITHTLSFKGLQLMHYLSLMSTPTVDELCSGNPLST